MTIMTLRHQWSERDSGLTSQITAKEGTRSSSWKMRQVRLTTSKLVGL